MLDPQLLRKNGVAVQRIACDLLSFGAGERIPCVHDYARRLQFGSGTVQAAFRLLEEAGAVRLEKHGHRGTYLAGVNTPVLWGFTGVGTVIGAMPLPYSRRYEGLATGLRDVFRAAGIPFALSFMRGSVNRMQALLDERCDLAIMSRLAYDEAAVGSGELDMVAALGPASYVGSHALLVRTDGPHGAAPGMRVGVDPESTDQNVLTRAEFDGLDVQFVEVPYMQMMEKLARREIDATVWNADEVQFRAMEVKAVPLKSPKARLLAERNTEAVVVMAAGRRELVGVVRRVLDAAAVRAVQGEVMAGRRVPSY